MEKQLMWRIKGEGYGVKAFCVLVGERLDFLKRTSKAFCEGEIGVLRDHVTNACWSTLFLPIN